MDRYVTISEASQIKGVSIDTLRLWETKGILIPERTIGGHRRYKLSGSSVLSVLNLLKNKFETLAWLR
ncbi:MAG: MerR family DNA-binding transcriptional regulator [Gloeotrichia echinulata CP02]|nr:MerR family DNA-binding transcriptional regulator [Gloeotrichia echinulata DEX184]